MARIFFGKHFTLRMVKPHKELPEKDLIVSAEPKNESELRITVTVNCA
jgi:hypothetical protein